MYIHRRYFFALDRKAGQTAFPLRIRVQWGERGCHYLNIGVGVSVEPDKWSREARRCKANTTHGDRRLPASVLNKRISEVEEAIDAAFRAAELAEHEPTPPELRAAVNRTLGRTTRGTPTGDTLPELYRQYIFEASKERQWTDGTVRQMMSFGRSLAERYPDRRPQDLDGRFIANFAADETASGTSNRTAKNHLSLLRTFGRWLDAKRGARIDQSFYCEAPRMKTVARNVIYLTPDELLRLYEAEYPSKSVALAADILLLCSFTGLRISDACALRHESIQDGCIEVRTKKTGKALSIEMNAWSRRIIDRIRERYDGTDGYVLPRGIERSYLAKLMRKACHAAGITSKVTQTIYRGSERIDRTGAKWEFISTHTGRRTFVCNALSIGIPPQVVMKWTGHSDYAAMKPYIDIIDAAKASNMAKFDGIMPDDAVGRKNRHKSH